MYVYWQLTFIIYRIFIFANNLVIVDLTNNIIPRFTDLEIELSNA